MIERRSLLDWVIRPALRTVPGVADVNSLGGFARSFEVVPNNARMNARGVSLMALREALETNNRNDGAGRLVEGEETLLVRAEGRIRSVSDVDHIVIGSFNGVPVRIGDVADVRIGAITRYGAVTRNGEGEAVEGRWGCAAPTPARSSRACGLGSRSCNPPCPTASLSTSSMIEAIWWTVLNEKASQIAVLVRGIDGSEDVWFTENEGVQYLKVEFDRLALGRLGLDVEEIEAVLRAQIEGLEVGTVYEGTRRTPCCRAVPRACAAPPPTSRTCA
jgi:Cu/Ag efflux pump CusA